MESKLPKETINAYKQAIYIVDTGPPLEFKIGQDSVLLKNLLKSRGANTAAWITAYNPYGSKQTEEKNKSLQKQLLKIADDKSLDYMTGRGVDSEHKQAPEESLLLFNLPLSIAIEIGQQVNQNAIVWIGEEEIPRLVLLV